VWQLTACDAACYFGFAQHRPLAHCGRRRRVSRAHRPARRIEIDDPVLRSTTLVVVATNVAYSKTQLSKIAMMANSGGAWTIRPYYTTGDGDQLFAVSTGRLRAEVPVSMMGTLAEVVAEAIVRGVKAARSVLGWTAAADLG
jgi:L-aminopeptidase/D-esterase-like protein